MQGQSPRRSSLTGKRCPRCGHWAFALETPPPAVWRCPYCRSDLATWPPGHMVCVRQGRPVDPEENRPPDP